MRVGLNLLPLMPGRAGGLRQHISGLLEQLLTIDEDTEYVCFVKRYDDHRFLKPNPRVHVVDLPAATTELERRIRAGEIDVMFACCMDRGTDTPICPTVFLLSDLEHQDYPENFSPDELSKRRLKWDAGARSSQRVAVSSEFLLRRAQEKLLIPSRKMVLAPPPIVGNRIVDALSDTQDRFVRLRARLPERYLFFPARTSSRKNHKRLLEAFARMETEVDAVHLVLAGSEGSVHSATVAAVRRLGLRFKVHWIGRVADDLVSLLCRDAVALAFPSLYEGFCGSLLEAMHAGCPIVCSNTTACPEVAGDAALTFDPLDVDAIRGALERICNDASLRDELRKAGERRLGKIDPQTGARNLLAAFRAALEEYEDPYRWHWVAGAVPAPSTTPLVSIITPSFQQAAFIRDTLESVRSQSYPRVEHIVVDGGSTDGTVDILKSYSDSIRWVSENDRGQAHAVNKGLAMAKGEIIGWLNSDDTYLAEAIGKAVEALSKPSGCWLVYGEAYYTDVNGRIERRYPAETYSVANLLRHNIICQPAVFFHRRLLDLAGLLDERYFMAMDYEYWLRCSKVTPFLYVPEFLATSRLYADNKTARFRRRSAKEALRACRKHYNRTSPLWCWLYASSIAETMPLVKDFRPLMSLVRRVLFKYAWVRTELGSTVREVRRRIDLETHHW